MGKPEDVPAFQHQFDDAQQQYEASALGMWIFLATEVMFFGGLFAGYVVYRGAYPEAWAEGSRHLDITLGAVNTVVLIGSSLTMALAVRSAQIGRRGGQLLFLLLTILLGSVFLGIKAIEYGEKFREHLVPGTSFRWEGSDPQHVQLFYSFYFAMTGMHALHMVVGVGLLAVLLLMARRGRFSPAYYTPVEIVGLYWHFVDIVWIYLFPLLYLVDRHVR
ncbi:MAG: cytochrome c oxidase subunit 3 family protein [Candidatus Methylomirabilales bacterium]